MLVFLDLIAGAHGTLAFLEAGGSASFVASLARGGGSSSLTFGGHHKGALARCDGGSGGKGGGKGGNPRLRFRPGDIVRIRGVGKEEAQRMQKDHGGINDNMLGMLGTDGHVVKDFSGLTVTVQCKGQDRSYSWVSETISPSAISHSPTYPLSHALKLFFFLSFLSFPLFFIPPPPPRILRCWRVAM